MNFTAAVQYMVLLVRDWGSVGSRGRGQRVWPTFLAIPALADFESSLIASIFLKVSASL